MDMRKPHILLVDDDSITLEVLEGMLAAQHYQVTSVTSGAKALELLENNHTIYSAVILDRMMPNMSGIDFLHKIYSSSLLRKIPIIMLTSHAEREDVSAAVVAGVFDFLYKPIDQELLFLVLKRALSKETPI
jgi:CheY-like chemotaxis protein